MYFVVFPPFPQSPRSKNRKIAGSVGIEGGDDLMRRLRVEDMVGKREGRRLGRGY